jgi:hypothetical protein
MNLVSRRNFHILLLGLISIVMLSITDYGFLNFLFAIKLTTLPLIGIVSIGKLFGAYAFYLTYKLQRGDLF